MRAGAAGFGIYVEYDRDLFDPTTIHRLLDHFATLLETAAEEPDAPLSTLPLLSAAERHQLLLEWAVSPEAPWEIPVIDRFAAQAADAPERQALVFGGEALTYGELDRRAGRVARALARRGVGSGSLVGLFIERSNEMVIALLGIWKAGGAYLPLEPGYPRERLALMLEDARLALIVTQERLLSRLPESATEILCVEGLGEETGGDRERGLAVVRGEDLAYVIYTSGSTGRPKGVMVSYGNLASVLAACRREHGWNASDVMVCLAPFSFDIFLFELLNPLLAGGTVVLLPLKPAIDLGHLMELLPGLTRLHAVPALLRQIAAVARHQDIAARRLATVFVGGDRVPLELLADLRETFPGSEVRVLYGPTEGTIICANHALAAGETPACSLLGRPLAGAEILLCDRGGNPVPMGAHGEIWIGGRGVTCGYLGRDDLTAERYPVRDGRRFYRTGDLARWRPSGDLEFLGRIDRQVKVRGFRIEPGEIETALAAHPAVCEAVVLAVDEPPGDRRLVAFVVPVEEGEISAELRDFLRARLPDYMVPGEFIQLAALPLSPHGKVDRQALLRLATAPEHRSGPAPGRVAPRNPGEALLAEAWRQVLRRQEVGVYDNFFELGGDSILSLQVVSRLARQGWRLSPAQLFEHPTIAELASRMEESGGLPGAGERPAIGPVPLTPAQHRFFAQGLEHPEHFNQALLLAIERPAAGERLDGPLLRRALAHLMAHHDALRLRFVPPALEGEPWRQVSGAGPEEPSCVQIDLSALPAERQAVERQAAAAALQGSLDLVSGPLLRAALLTAPGGEDRLLVILHHLVVDGVSWRILLEDLEISCRQLARGEAVALPPMTASLRRWAELLAARARSDEVAAQQGFWQAVLASPQRLPIDHDLGPDTEAWAETVMAALDREETRALLTEAPRAYRTQINDLLLTALARAFEPWTRSRRLRIELEGHGREEIIAGVDLSRTVGWLTAVFPVLLDLEEATEPGAALKTIKETLRRVPDRGIGYDLLRFLGGEQGRDLGSRQAAEVLIN
jgi:amino acid adenylation domain-containing protein